MCWENPNEKSGRNDVRIQLLQILGDAGGHGVGRKGLSFKQRRLNGTGKRRTVLAGPNGEEGSHNNAWTAHSKIPYD